MLTTKEIHHFLQKEIPDLFVEDETVKSSSMLFAEFLPALALSDPNGNPWGQYGNREIPLRKKTIVISFKNISLCPFAELEDIDAIACFLKRAEFSVLIPFENELQDYNMQLFERKQIDHIGNKSRVEIQKLARGNNIPTDELFFIDDVKKDLDASIINNIAGKFLKLSIKDCSETKKGFILNEGIDLNYFIKRGVSFEKIMSLEFDLFKLVCVNGYQISALLEKGVSFEKIIQLQPDELRKIVCKKGGDIAPLISKKCSFDQLIQLQPTELQHLVFENGHAIARLQQKGVHLQEIITLEPEELRKLVCKNASLINYLIPKKVTFEQLIKLEPTELRTAVFQNAHVVDELIKHGVGFEQLINLQPDLRTIFFRNLSCFEHLIRNGITFDRLKSFEMDLLEFISQYSGYFIGLLMKKGVAFEQLIGLQPASLRESIFKYASDISNLVNLNIAFDWFLQLSVSDFEFINKNSIQICQLIKDKIITPQQLNEMAFNHFKTHFPDYKNKTKQPSLSHPYTIEDLVERGVPLAQFMNLPPAVRDVMLRRGVGRLVTFEQLFSLELSVMELVCNNNFQVDQLIKAGVTLDQLVKIQPPSLRELFFSGSYKLADSIEAGVRLDDLLPRLSDSEDKTVLSLNTVLNDSPLLSSILCYQLVIDDACEHEITLSSFPLLNRLVITICENAYPPMILCDRQMNLIELSVKGEIETLDTIFSIIENAPNLRLLELSLTDIQKNELSFLAALFPELSINVISRQKTTREERDRDRDRAYDAYSDDCYQSRTAASFQPPMQKGKLSSRAHMLSFSTAPKQVSKKGEDDVVYTGLFGNQLIDDFTTQQSSNTTVSLKKAYKHLTNSKPSRFKITRNHICVLDDKRLFVTVTSRSKTPYVLPDEVDQLPADESHDFYEKYEQISLKSGQVYKFDSLSAQDILFQINLNGRRLTASDAELTKDEFGFFELIAKKELKGRLNYVMDVPSETDILDLIPDDLWELIEEISNFGSSPITELRVGESAATRDKLNAMFTQRIGGCQNRMAVLLHKFRELKEKKPHQFDQIKINGVARGGVHADVEVSVDGGKIFESIDLGGYEIPVQYTSGIDSEIVRIAGSDHRANIRISLDGGITYGLLELSGDAIQKQYANVKARIVNRHNDPTIEISINGGITYDLLTLSAYDIKELFNPFVLPRLQFSSKKSADALKPTFLEVLRQINLGRGKNTLLCLKESSDIYTCLVHIRQACINRPIFYVDSPGQLRTSLKCLQINDQRTECNIATPNPGAGLLYDFLMTHKHSEPAPILVINWENFTCSDMVQFNSVLDIPHRRADSTPIPMNAMIVGLHSKNEKMMDLLGDSSLVSRHATGGVHDFSRDALSLLPNERQANVSSVLKINLHRSPRWLDILIGKAFVDGRQLRWTDGPLLKILDDRSITHIELINPPTASRVFNHFAADFCAGLPLTVFNQTLLLRERCTMSISEKPELTKGVNLKIKLAHRLEKDAFIINASTFEQCLHGKKIDDEGFLITEKGLLEVHQDLLLKLCLHTNLSDSQWSLLLEAAKNFNVTLELSITANVMLPKNMAFIKEPTSTVSPEVLLNQFIVSDDVEYTVADVEKNLTGSVSIIDLSEVSPDDLFYKVTHCVRDNHFEFKKRYSDIWSALKKGETVILKGCCSEEALNYLASFFSPAPYFLMDGKKQFFSGKLIVIAENALIPPQWLHAHEKKITMKQKREALGLLPDESTVNKSFIQLKLEKEKQEKASLILELPTMPDGDDLSIEACEVFEKRRLLSVKNILTYSPFVLLEGPPGVGKSYFVHAFKMDSMIKFYSEEHYDQWATELVPEGVQKILFRDEINLRGVDCSQDSSLLNSSPSIYINLKEYSLTKNCKIMYVQNPTCFGGNRHEPKLLKELAQLITVQFEEMSLAFVVHRILKPIFATVFNPIESEVKAVLMGKTDLSTMRSIRDLQSKAIFTCALATYPIQSKQKKNEMSTPLNQWGEGISGAEMNECLGVNGFVLTASRVGLYQNVLTLLHARLFKRELPLTAPDGARFNGVNGLVLQGASGIGKSEFIMGVLDSENYFINDFIPKHNQEAADFFLAKQSGHIYYRLTASMEPGLKIKILDEAFQQGALLIIDEIDSCPLLEDRLNAYLTGEDLSGKRPEKPGFTILSTANGGAMKGRRIIPAPLLSRLMAFELKEYSRDELIAILETKCVLPYEQALRKEMVLWLVDEFLADQESNRESPPTFRDLDIFAKNYFEDKFSHYFALELSKEQHQFMLAYRDHPKLQSISDRLESHELTASELTLPRMKKFLETEANLQSFFKMVKPPAAAASSKYERRIGMQ